MTKIDLFRRVLITTTLGLIKVINPEVFARLDIKIFCILYLHGSQNKQQLLPYTALTDLFLLPRHKLFPGRYELGL